MSLHSHKSIWQSHVHLPVPNIIEQDFHFSTCLCFLAQNKHAARFAIAYKLADLANVIGLKPALAILNILSTSESF